MYKVDFKPAALRKLRKLARRITRSDWMRLEQAIDSLSVNPRSHGAVKLSGTDFYRIRVGDYRVIYVTGVWRILNTTISCKEAAYNPKM